MLDLIVRFDYELTPGEGTRTQKDIEATQAPERVSLEDCTIKFHKHNVK